jgi:hypothetical protein
MWRKIWLALFEGMRCCRLRNKTILSTKMMGQPWKVDASKKCEAEHCVKIAGKGGYVLSVMALLPASVVKILKNFGISAFVKKPWHHRRSYWPLNANENPRSEQNANENPRSRRPRRSKAGADASSDSNDCRHLWRKFVVSTFSQIQDGNGNLLPSRVIVGLRRGALHVRSQDNKTENVLTIQNAKIILTIQNTKIILTIPNMKIILARNVRPNILRQLIGDNVCYVNLSLCLLESLKLRPFKIWRSSWPSILWRQLP